jgi:hypothetical protein
MRIAALRHTEMAKQLAVLRSAVSSVVEFMLRRSLNETFHVEVVDELVAEFQKLEEWRSWLERSGLRIWDLLLGSPFGQAQLTDCLNEAAGQVGVSWLHGGRQTQSRRPCGLQLCRSKTWYWTGPTGHLP